MESFRISRPSPICPAPRPLHMPLAMPMQIARWVHWNPSWILMETIWIRRIPLGPFGVPMTSVGTLWKHRQSFRIYSDVNLPSATAHASACGHANPNGSMGIAMPMHMAWLDSSGILFGFFGILWDPYDILCTSLEPISFLRDPLDSLWSPSGTSRNPLRSCDLLKNPVESVETIQIS